MVSAIVTEAKCKEPVKRKYTAKTAREKKKKKTIDRQKKEKRKERKRTANITWEVISCRSASAASPAVD